MQKPTPCIYAHARTKILVRTGIDTPMGIYHCLVFEDFLLKFLRFQKVKNKR